MNHWAFSWQNIQSRNFYLKTMTFTFCLSPDVLWFSFHCFSICIYISPLLPYKHRSITLRLQLSLFSIRQGVTALSDITAVVGKYRFADGELMWQLGIIEFHSQQCSSLSEWSFYSELCYLALLEYRKELYTAIWNLPLPDLWYFARSSE